MIIGVALMLTSCAQVGFVVSAPPGSMVKGDVQVHLQDGTIKTMNNTNLYVKEEKVKAKYTVKVRGNKIVKILAKPEVNKR